MLPWLISLAVLSLIAAVVILLVRRRRAAAPLPAKDAAMLRAREAMSGLERHRQRAAKGSIRRQGSGNAGVDGASYGNSPGADGGGGGGGL